MTRSIDLASLAACAALIAAALLLARPVGPLTAVRRCGAFLRAGEGR
jgi:hypothetical protein